VPPSGLQFEHLDAQLVLAFLADLQTSRSNSPRKSQVPELDLRPLSVAKEDTSDY